VLGKDFDAAPEWYLAEVKRLISDDWCGRVLIKDHTQLLCIPLSKKSTTQK